MPLTIVMYHYVRDLARSRYPELKALDAADFRAQLDYLAHSHTFVRLDDVLSGDVPANAALLTFDDGYIDHYETVFPLLARRGIQGLFFPVAMPILEQRVLDVNKIQFVLSVVRDKKRLVDAILEEVEANRTAMDLLAPAEYWKRYARPSRFDCAEVVFFKRMLQKHLPEPLRAQIADRLFHRYVTADEPAFSHELYMSPGQLRTMIDAGMYVGSHTYSHYWMDTLPPSRQGEEIRCSLNFLRALGAPVLNWVMCYPYGAWNEALLRILHQAGCALGLTTRPAAADLSADNALLLPRFDTTEAGASRSFTVAAR
jgi:peptidoglycan/xylan/chitin deacetylase (PgdA/CDA1 family)